MAFKKPVFTSSIAQEFLHCSFRILRDSAKVLAKLRSFVKLRGLFQCMLLSEFSLLCLWDHLISMLAVLAGGRSQLLRPLRFPLGGLLTRCWLISSKAAEKSFSSGLTQSFSYFKGFLSLSPPRAISLFLNPQTNGVGTLIKELLKFAIEPNCRYIDPSDA